MPKHDLGFKYRLGQIVVRKGFLPSAAQPTAPRFEVISQLLQAAPSGPRHVYYLRPAAEHRPTNSRLSGELRVWEDSLTPAANG